MNLLPHLNRTPIIGKIFPFFYEKVIKVKADVAALLNFSSDVSIDVRW